MRALITGGRGFVGTWLAEHLVAQGDTVVAIDQEVDVTDGAALRPAVADAAPDVIYHLAALAHVGDSWDAPSTVLGVNVVGTAELLAAARALPSAPTVLVISSAEVYGVVTESDLPLTEASAVAPATPYAASKAAAEQVALQAFRGYGQPVIVVRPFNHIGPRQSPNFAVAALARRIVEAQRQGRQSLTVGTLTTWRDFTDVRDVVRGYRLLAGAGAPGRIYNICSGRDVAIAQVAERLLALAGAHLDLVSDPALIRPVDVPVLRGDCGLLSAATGWAPQIDLDQTLTDTLAYWRDQPAAGD